ncbi:MAG TPA: hypothetical protein VFQ81_02655 [Candidatus Limnocylindria bacterium]|nr:hypothetical protein [Candidatus Limnocylindria bacterium]
MIRSRPAALTALLTLLLAACSGTAGVSSESAATPVPSAAATRHPYPDATGTLASADPILRATAIEDMQFFNPGAAILHDGTYHVYGFAFGDGQPRAMHLTSTDALAWEPAADPDWTTIALDPALAQPGPIPTSVLVEPDGTWVVYGWGFLDGTNPAPTVAWRATGPGPDGPWTADPGIILSAGDGDAWDGQGLFALSVVTDGDGYRMTYSASSRLFPNHGEIGMATSPDGVTWTKFDRPTAARELAESDPIVQEALCGDYDAGAVFQPQLSRDASGYRLLYSGFTVGAGPTTIVRAVSPDGDTWTCGGAAVTEALFPGTDGINGFTLIRGDEAHLIVEALDAGGDSSSLWLVTP